MSKRMISVVIPCRNQDKKIGVTIDHIIKTAKTLKDFQVEVVFVNDRSSDDSAQLAEKHLQGYPLKQILHTDTSYVGNGKGMAVELGMTQAKGDYRLFMDADNSTRFEEVSKLIPYFDKYDIVLGTRYSNTVVEPSGNWFKSFWLAVVDVIQVLIYGHAKRYTAKTKQGRLRELVSRGGNLAFTVLLGQSFTDSRCGFKMYSKSASEKIFPLCRIKTWDFDSEALVLAKKFGYKMIEVPVVWFDDAGASNFKVSDMINAFRAIFQIRFNQFLGRYGGSVIRNAGMLLLGIFLVAGVVFSGNRLYEQKSCGFAREIKSYVGMNENAFYYGRRVCSDLRGINELELSDVKNIPKDNGTIILAREKQPRLKEELEKHFLGVNEYKAGEGSDSFAVYEVICQTCNQN